MKLLLRALNFGCVCCLCYLCSWPSQAEEPQPRYPKKVERPRPPVGPDGKPLLTVDGRWYSDFGYMELEQDQWTFEGTYSCCEGKIHGELVANQIEFYWEDAIYGKGWGYYRWGENGRRLNGVWGTEADMGSSGGWRSVRLEPRSYDGEPSRWSFVANHPQLGEVRGETVLYVSQDGIAGQLEGAAETTSEAYPEGARYRHEVLRYLEGHAEGDEILLEWHNPLTDRKGNLNLTRIGDRLEGLWHITEDIEEPITLRRLPETSP